MCVVIVEAGDIRECLATRVLETLKNFFVDLFKCFDAIRRKGRRNDCNVLLASFGKARHLFDEGWVTVPRGELEGERSERDGVYQFLITGEVVRGADPPGPDCRLAAACGAVVIA